MATDNNIGLIPWETMSLPLALQGELNRRRNDKSFNFIDSTQAGWDSETGDWKNYLGPRRAWVRVCSNGLGRPKIGKPGFVLTNGNGFYETYGFKKTEEGNNQQIIGYTPDGRPHVIDNETTNDYPIHVPPPSIVRVEVLIQKELIRQCNLHFVCFSPKQLEYLTPYFFNPKTTLIVEWGWNHFNPNSLLDLTDENKLRDYMFKNTYKLYNENILLSNGNYDIMYGRFTNFEWSMEGNKINCMTEIKSWQRLYAGIPISAAVVEREDVLDPKKGANYFINLEGICNNDLISNLIAISSCKTLEEAETKPNINPRLLNIITGKKNNNSSIPMKQEYWRGIFFGRNNDLISKSANIDAYKWDVAKKGDFDASANSNTTNVWVNMGFLVELINRALPVSVTNDGVNAFDVDVEESVIGAHPNLISSDSSVLLIPNGMAPKYMWGFYGERQNAWESQYLNQYLSGRDDTRFARRDIAKEKENKDDVLWKADVKLADVFKQGRYPERDDLDVIINATRYIYPTERACYSFPFSVEEAVEVKNREGKLARYDPYFYGYFKDLYFNVKKFVSIVTSGGIKTYNDLYLALFDEINKAGGNFWELVLVLNENTNKMMVVDKKMLPSGNNKATPFYFDYLDANSVMTGLAFRPLMSEAQSFRDIFGDSQSSGSNAFVNTENDLTDLNIYGDRILRKNIDTTQQSSKDSKKDPYLDQIEALQKVDPKSDCCQFTITVDNKPYFRRLALPDSELAKQLLLDNDLERNQRLTGIQPITVEVSLQGLGGLRTFMSFLIKNLPNPYHHKDVAYRIVDVRHTLQDGKWDTVIRAGIIPLRGYIKEKLGITE